MRKSHKGNDYEVTYNDSREVRDEVFRRVVAWFIKHESFHGEVIMQSDGPIIDAPLLLSDIADDVMGFGVTWDDEDGEATDE